MFDKRHRCCHPLSGTVTSTVLLVVFLCLVQSTDTMGYPITATFSSYHENTASGIDTTLDSYNYFGQYFEQPTGSTYVFQLWTQPSTEGPSVYLFSPTATQTSRSMGVLTSFGKVYCRAVALRESKELFLVSTMFATLQIHFLLFNTLANTYSPASWRDDDSSTSSPWSILSEPMFTDYLYFIDGYDYPTCYLYKWNSKLPARDPGPCIQLGTDICRSWQF